jgi:SpoIID/LytB domain protein
VGNNIIKIIFFICLLFFNSHACFSEPLVRVGISDTNFKNLVYDTITIIATDSFAMYDKASSKLIMKFNKDDKVKFIYNNGKFDIQRNGNLVAKNYSGTAIIHCPNGILGITGLKRKSKQALYHGIFEITPRNNDKFFVINVLDLQEYLKGVVPNEMPVSFGLEALKAQAIAARNYVLMPRTRAYKEFDVDDSVASQVYFGANTESELSTQAVNETLGLVALYDWEVILAQYCSTAGGYTEDYSNAFSDNKLKIFPAQPKPYLKGKPDIYNTPTLETEEAARKFYMTKPNSYDINSPYYRWQKEFERTELEQTLKKTLASQSKTGFVYPIFSENQDIGELKEIKVLKRGVSGKIMELEIVTTKGVWKVSKELVIRRLLQKNGISLPSANVVFEHHCSFTGKLEKIIAYGGGFGHGVGMSQFGAGFMAKSLHRNFIDILKRYYTGISISTIPQVLHNKPITFSFYAPHKHAILVVDANCFVKSLNAEINGKTVELHLDKKFFSTDLRIDISKYITKGKNDITLSIPHYEIGKHVKFYVELVKRDE